MKRILIANRGEIACRIVRTVRRLGYQAVAVFSEVDADAPHVRMADDAVCIGAATASESYLNIARILDAARSSRADAVHPGYGFLAENAAFARACGEAGLVFIGPGADAIEVMGNKASAKRRMIEAGVPCVPGYEGEDQADEAFAEAAERIGFPVMIKASAGGGGRGMRLVTDEAPLAQALGAARSEAKSAFGSGELILEKALIRPRHVEIQVFADRHGNVVHLGERDCSVQRRHQKVVEEAPCPVVTPALRQAMGAAAVEVARSIGYLGAGTVEFLLDEGNAFHFLEMNTRLQVEHPVTECITGLDLVEWQIRVAGGEPLPLRQDQLRLTGHAIEVRIYAEDPYAGFLPVTGAIELWRAPGGEGIRVDAGIASGQSVSPHYDPLLAKIVATGSNREEARRRLVAALHETVVFGIETNRDFLIEVLESPRFVDGEATTGFVAERFGSDGPVRAAAASTGAAMAAVLSYRSAAAHALAASVRVSGSLMNWSSSGRLVTHYDLVSGGAHIRVAVRPQGSGRYIAEVDDVSFSLVVGDIDKHRSRVNVDGHTTSVLFRLTGDGAIFLSLDGRQYRYVHRRTTSATAQDASADGQVLAPMHGIIQTVFVEPGQTVEKGATLFALEAMKMQHEIVAMCCGRVGEIMFAAGDQVAAGQLVLTIGQDPDIHREDAR